MLKILLNRCLRAATCLPLLLLAPGALAEKPLLASQLGKAAPNLNPQVLQSALAAMQCAVRHGSAAATRLGIIDYSLPSSEPRLWIFDLQTRQLLLQDLVAHGQGSGDSLPTTFSNVEGSHQSSLGLFRTAESYSGQNGYSLRMDGLEPGFNDQARPRAIVIHPADYVDDSWVQRYGRIGRSFGCPAVRPEVATMVVDTLKGGQFLFAWYPDEHWLASSPMLNCPEDGAASLVARRD